MWESKADGAFAISEDTWNEPLGRGTEIKLHLRDEAQEYLEEGKLKVSIALLFSLPVCMFVNDLIHILNTKDVLLDLLFTRNNQLCLLCFRAYEEKTVQCTSPYPNLFSKIYIFCLYINGLNLYFFIHLECIFLVSTYLLCFDDTFQLPIDLSLFAPVITSFPSASSRNVKPNSRTLDVLLLFFRYLLQPANSFSFCIPQKLYGDI